MEKNIRTFAHAHCAAKSECFRKKLPVASGLYSSMVSLYSKCYINFERGGCLISISLIHNASPLACSLHFSCLHEHIIQAIPKLTAHLSFFRYLLLQTASRWTLFSIYIGREKAAGSWWLGEPFEM